MTDTPSAADPAATPPRLLSPWLVWAGAECASLFVAWVVLPVAYLVPGLVDPGPSPLVERLRLFWLQSWGIFGAPAYADDPVRTVQTVVGLAAGVASLVLLLFITVRLFGRRDRSWPPPIIGGRVARAIGQWALGAAMAAITLSAVFQPVPARPLDWWFLALATASVTAWTAARRPALTPASAVLAVSAALAMTVDLLSPPFQALTVPGGSAEALALAGAVVAAVAATITMVTPGAWRPRITGEADESAGVGAAGILVGTVLAAVFGALVIAASATWDYDSPTNVFGARVAGRQVVVFSPHMDDESAFAGETIAWLARNGARVTVVFTTDSAGGRALDKVPAYAAGRRLVMGRAGRELGISRVYVLNDIRDGNRMHGPLKIARMEEHVTDLGLVKPETILVSVSGTGHSDHRATFAAAAFLAAKAHLPLYVAWGYDDAHDTIGVPEIGRPLAIDGGPAALAAKAGAIDGYVAFYRDDYAFTFPRILLSSRGAHDVLSVIEPTVAASRPASASSDGGGVMRP